ncbi:L,D-transpeptidase family protein [Candidatus Poribacteria bacterium]
MKRFVPLIVLVFLLAIVGGIIFGFVRGKQRREAALNEFYLCETRFNEKQYASAAQLLETFLQAHPKNEKAEDSYYYLAMSYENLEDHSQAIAAWSKIIENYPESLRLAEAYYYSGTGYRSLEQYDKAMENYKMVVDRYSNMPVAAGSWYGIGRIYEAKGQDSDAVSAYRNVLEKDPGAEIALDAERRWGNINLKEFFARNTTTYKVEGGDSLVRIGAKFRITPERLMKLNGLTRPMLQRGQVLRVVEGDFNILVDLSKNKLFLKSGDAVIKKYNVGIGKTETPTPLGVFKVTDKLPNPVWYSTLPSGAKEAIPPGDPRNELGTRWIGFEPTNGSYGIHGTIAPESIGKAIGNGCVRMLNEDVEELYDLVVAETPVEIIPGTDNKPE